MTVNDILAKLKALAPLYLKESWDNCGLLVGGSERSVLSVLVSLDLTMDVIKEAKQMGAELIITHHPAIFTPMKNILFESVQGRKMIELIESGISVISMHTNLDLAKDGVNEALSKRLHLKNVEILEETSKESFKKIVVFVPPEFLERVRLAMFEAGAGEYEKYDKCCFVSEGEGSFRPCAEARPFIGTGGEFTTVREKKLEMILKADRLNKVLEAMRAAHPYEEPAFDLYDILEPKEAFGYGRIGDLPAPLSKLELLTFLKDGLLANGLRFAGSADIIRRVAVGAGALAGLSSLAFSKGADVYVTSDVKYHDFVDAAERGEFIVDAGHFATEDVIIPQITAFLSDAFPELEIQKSSHHKDFIEYFV